MKNIRKIFIVSIALIVGLLHFIIGPNYNGPLKHFISGYLIDILLPFAIYFLFTLNGLVNNKIIIASAVFLIGFSVETSQYFNIPILGTTFDPYDYLMYGIGVLIALLIDVKLITKLDKKYKNKIEG